MSGLFLCLLLSSKNSSNTHLSKGIKSLSIALFCIAHRKTLNALIPAAFKSKVNAIFFVNSFTNSALRGGNRESHRGEIEQARERLHKSVGAKLQENKQRFEKPGREGKSKIAQAIQNTRLLCWGDNSHSMYGHFISHPSGKQCLGGYEGMEEVGGAIQSPKPEPRIQQVHYG